MYKGVGLMSSLTRCIPASILRKLPIGKPLGMKIIRDINRMEREVVIWEFGYDSDRCRRGYFCIETGEYIGDALFGSGNFK